MWKLIRGILNLFSSGKNPKSAASGAVQDLTGKTYEEAVIAVLRDGYRAAHHEWPAGDFIFRYYEEDGRHIYKREKGKEVCIRDWKPSVAERYGGCGWDILESTGQ